MHSFHSASIWSIWVSRGREYKSFFFFFNHLETLGYAMAPESALRMEVFGAPPAGAEGA